MTLLPAAFRPRAWLTAAPVALECTFTGYVLFLVGAHVGWRWPVAGGVMMFTGAFAAALLGALG